MPLILRHHKYLDEVKEALKKPTTLDSFIEEKRVQGMYKFNLQEVKKAEYVETNLLRERRATRPGDKVKMCTVCKKFLSVKNLYRHKEMCGITRTIKPQELDMPALHENGEFVAEILNKFRDGEVGNMYRHNPLIKLIGYRAFCSRRHEVGKFNNVRKEVMTEMRELTRLYLRFLTIVGHEVSLEQMFQRWRHINEGKVKHKVSEVNL